MQRNQHPSELQVLQLSFRALPRRQGVSRATSMGTLPVTSAQPFSLVLRSNSLLLRSESHEHPAQCTIWYHGASMAAPRLTPARPQDRHDSNDDPYDHDPQGPTQSNMPAGPRLLTTRRPRYADHFKPACASAPMEGKPTDEDAAHNNEQRRPSAATQSPL